MTTNGQTCNKALVATTSRPNLPAFSLRQAMNRLFDEFGFASAGFAWPTMPLAEQFAFMPRVDVKETDKEIVISAEIPGMDPNNIDVSLVGDQLVIKGEKKEEKEEKSAAFHRVERSYGYFERMLPLPTEVLRDKIDASYKDGVLKIRMAKTVKATENVKKIEVKTEK